jgi:outer membrane protein X
MKKVIVTLSILFFVAAVMPAMAQKGEMKIGPQVGYGFDIKALGIGAKFTYGITDEIRLAPSFVYFLPETAEESSYGMTVKTSTNWWELNLDGNYMFGDEDELSFYGLAGLNVLGVSSSVTFTGLPEGADETPDTSVSETEIGLNVGGGAQYSFSDSMKGFAELKYSTAGKQLGVCAGLLFSL